VDEVIRTARRPVREGAGARTDLTALVRERVAFWSPLAEDDGREIALSVPLRPVAVRCAAGDLSAALDALIQNVFAHTPAGTGMRVTVSPDGALTVSDDGPGLPAEAAERGAAGSGSTGLGLDIARRTASASGGSMQVGAGVSGGAEVRLRFGTIVDDPS
jgi:signal transduction histidine kinase